MIDLEQVLDFIESEEMRNYLREELPKHHFMSAACADIVAYAPASIERKFPVLDAIACHTAHAPNGGESWEAQLAWVCRSALEERYSGPAGAVLWLQDYYGCERDFLFCDAFFTDFDAALCFLEEASKKDPESLLDPQVSFTITKLIPSSGGRLEESCVWYLNNTRELWYFDFCDRRLQINHSSLIDYCGADLNLPFPFKPGDIVTTDCLPYALPRRVLILEIGDNSDCCCVQALSIHEGGRLMVGAFKHNHFFGRETSHVSGLYRVRRYTGSLSTEEEPFSILSPLLKERPELGMKILSFMWESKGHATSVVWPQLKQVIDTFPPYGSVLLSSESR